MFRTSEGVAARARFRGPYIGGWGRNAWMLSPPGVVRKMKEFARWRAQTNRAALDGQPGQLSHHLSTGTRFRCWLGLLAKHDRELVLAGGGGVVEGFGGAVGFRSFEEEAALDALRQSGEAGFAINVGADFEIEFASVHESVGDADFDLSGVNRRARFVSDREVDAAWPDVAIHDGNRFGVRRLGVGREWGRDDRQRKNDRQENRGEAAGGEVVIHRSQITPDVARCRA